MSVDKLRQIGLTEKEAKIYLAALPLGPASISILSQKAKVNRTTAYQILESLAKKGLVVWQVTPLGKKVKANEPKKILDFLEVEKEKIESNKKILKILLPELKKMFSPEEMETRLLYFEGVEGVKEMIWNTLEAKGEMVGYTIFERNRLLGRRWADKYRRQALKKGIYERIIIPDSQDFSAYSKETSVSEYWQKLIKIRSLPAKKFYVSNDYMIYNDKTSVALFKEGKLFGVTIQNEEIAKTQKSIFETIWAVAQPVRLYNNFQK